MNKADPERLGGLPRITQQESGGVGIEIQSPCSFPHAMWPLVMTTQVLTRGTQEVKPDGFLGFSPGTEHVLRPQRLHQDGPVDLLEVSAEREWGGPLLKGKHIRHGI